MEKKNKTMSWDDVEKDIHTEKEIKIADHLFDIIASIIDRRKALGISVEQLSEKSGVDKTIIEDLEDNGSGMISINDLLELTYSLGLNVGLNVEEK